MEIRRRSGRTGEELGNLFAVSCRSIHHWANGKPVAAKRDRVIRRVLTALRDLNRGDQERTRDLLLTVDQATGVTTFDLLRDGRFREAMGRVDCIPAVVPRRIPLSDAAWEMCRPPSPMLFLEAGQGRPDIPANARAIRLKRISKTAG